MSAAQLVGFTVLNLRTFLPVMQSATGRNVGSVADEADLDPPLHHMVSVAAIKDQNIKASAESVRNYAHMFHAIIVVGCDERDTAEVLSIAAMPSIVQPTKVRGVDCVLLAGTVEQWIDAVMRGCHRSVSREVRQVYNSVYQLFAKLKMKSLFPSPTENNDQTFYLT
ncbi:MAG: hypothetical protein E6Q97_00515 [Desulfurellales bacterium]|nr:MAG: hypothetical protein E6Q97_00515 [Desulfurellales bacterium]